MSGADHDHADHKRSLRGSSLPPVAVLYGGGDRLAPGGASPRARTERWIGVLEGVEEIQHLWVEDSIDPLPPSSLLLHRAPAERLDPLHPRFGGGDSLPLGEGSALWCPAPLRITPPLWEELRTDNNTEVDWLMIDPRSSRSELPRVQLLSDWVRGVGEGVAPARSAGRTPGLMHLRPSTLRGLPPGSGGRRSLSALIGALIGQPARKLRPAWVRRATWRWSSEGD